MDIDRGNQLIRHLNPDHGYLVWDWGDADPCCAQRQGDIVRQIGQLVQPDSLVQFQLIPGHRGAPCHVDDVGVDSKGVDRISEALPVGVELHQRLATNISCPLSEQG